jgi:hypothetical protein
MKEKGKQADQSGGVFSLHYRTFWASVSYQFRRNGQGTGWRQASDTTVKPRNFPFQFYGFSSKIMSMFSFALFD